MLADRDIQRSLIEGDLVIDPYDPSALQPSSYDVTLDRHFLVPSRLVTEIDMADVQPGHMVPMVANGDGFVMEPGDFVLGSTRERVKIGDRLLGRVEGKSSIGRLGLLVHLTAGFIDPGFEGQVTLELFNAAPWEITLYPGQKIAQLAFSALMSHPLRTYGQAGNHYQGQSGPVESRFAGATPLECATATWPQTRENT